MYEGPKLFGEDQDDGAQEEPFDYLVHAEKLRKERQALDEQKKAEKKAKEAEKKAEKEARLAKKIADKATEKLEQKAGKVSEKSEDAKATVEKVEGEIDELSSELKDAVKEASPSGDELPAPVEMTFGNGSEYTTDTLAEGEGAIFDLRGSVEKVKETIDLADEVSEQAEALARARATLETVDPEEVGVSYEGLEDNTAVYGEMGPQDDLRQRLRHAWELAPDSSAVSEQLEDKIESVAMASPVETPIQLQTESSSYSGPSASEGYSGPTQSRVSAYEQVIGTEKKEEPVTTKVSSGIKTGLAFMGGLFVGRSKSIKKTLEKTSKELRSETQDLRREVEQIQTYPTQSVEQVLPQATFRPELTSVTHGTEVSRTVQTAAPIGEVRGRNEPAIPAWIKQIESEVKRGKAPELKKWQIDVLKSQHPDILKNYQKLDSETKQVIKTQSLETSKTADYIQRANPMPTPNPLQQPGELPMPNLASMPAFMTPTDRSIPPAPAPILGQPAYDVVMNTGSSMSGVSGAYLTNVLVGGLVVGAVLIALFGF